MLNKKTKQGERMNKCKICNDKPNEIFIGFLAKQDLKICKSCMSKHGDSHVIIDGEDNFIPTDYFYLRNNKEDLNMNIPIVKTKERVEEIIDDMLSIEDPSALEERA
tara:strand:- start:617 stop:937 length:321 start_codon:yes stop_codon:yes gene_type:complete